MCLCVFGLNPRISREPACTSQGRRPTSSTLLSGDIIIDSHRSWFTLQQHATTSDRIELKSLSELFIGHYRALDFPS